MKDEKAQTLLTYRGRHWSVGTMVIVSITIAVLLTVILQKWAFEASIKWDLTSSGINSLSPGTVAVLDSLKESDEKIRLTSLYFKTDIESNAQKQYRESVDDLLRLYQREAPSRVEISWLNPLKNQAELTELLNRLRTLPEFVAETEPYRNATQQFLTEDFPALQSQLQNYIVSLNEATGTMPMMEGGSSIKAVERAIQSWVQVGEEVAQSLMQLEQKGIVSYSAGIENIRMFYRQVGDKMEVFTQTFVDEVLRTGKQPDAIEAVLQQMQNELGQWTDQFKSRLALLDNLPPLDFEKLTTAFGGQGNVVIVESTQSAKALTFDQVWPAAFESQVRKANDSETRRFAGEGVITPAILSLVRGEKTAIVFVRYAGEALFGSAGFGQFAQQGNMMQLKSELEKLDYLVAEWDLKTTQEAPVFDETIRRAIYVVLRPGPSMTPQGIQSGVSMSPIERAAILQKISESGRALFMTGWENFSPQYEYDEYLKTKWGIDVDGGTLIVSAMPTAPGEWRLNQSFMLLSDVEFASHGSTRGLSSLQCLFPLATTMKAIEEAPDEIEIQQLVYVGESEDVWAVNDVEYFLEQYKEARGRQGAPFTRRLASDLASPFPLVYAAEQTAASPTTQESAEGEEADEETTEGSVVSEDRPTELDTSAKDVNKIVVMACGERFLWDALAFSSELVMLPGNRLEVRRQAPGNFALFVNLIHYLDDTLHWANVGTPTDTSRIEVAPRQLALWRFFVVGVWPAIFLLAGGVVWAFRRR